MPARASSSGFAISRHLLSFFNFTHLCFRSEQERVFHGVFARHLALKGLITNKSFSVWYNFYEILVLFGMSLAIGWVGCSFLIFNIFFSKNKKKICRTLVLVITLHTMAPTESTVMLLKTTLILDPSMRLTILLHQLKLLYSVLFAFLLFLAISS